MKTRSFLACFVLVVLGSLAATIPGSAAPVRNRSVEGPLFDDLKSGRSPILDPRKIDPRGYERNQPRRKGDPSPRSIWTNELGESPLSEEVLPLQTVVQRMRETGEKLRRADCGPATQHMQRQIVDSLDKILEQVRKQCRISKTGSCSKGGDSTQAEKNQDGQGQTATPNKSDEPGKTGDAHDATATGSERPGDRVRRRDPEHTRAMIKELWGQLPPRRRPPMSQLPNEEFLPSYELLIEEYFRRLSEETQGRTP